MPNLYSHCGIIQTSKIEWHRVYPSLRLDRCLNITSTASLQALAKTALGVTIVHQWSNPCTASVPFGTGATESWD